MEILITVGVLVAFFWSLVTWVPFIGTFRRNTPKVWNWRVLISFGPTGPIINWLDENRPDWWRL